MLNNRGLNPNLIDMKISYLKKSKKYHFVKYDNERLFKTYDDNINIIYTVEAKNEKEAIIKLFTDEKFIKELNSDYTIISDDDDGICFPCIDKINKEKSLEENWNSLMKYIVDNPQDFLDNIDSETGSTSEFNLIRDGGRLFDLLISSGSI